MMRVGGSKSGESGDFDARMAQYVAEISSRLTGDPDVDTDQLLRPYGVDAEHLRELIPSLRLLAEASQSGEAPQQTKSADGPAPTSIGDFRLLREAGRGGMGVVYEAHQIQLDRRVALKILPLASTLDKRHLARFQNEVRAAASLNHPNIVPVYSLDRSNGVHHYAMQFIDGPSLAEVISDLCDAEQTPSIAESETSCASTKHADNTNAEKALVSKSVGARRQHDRRAYFRFVAEIGAQLGEALYHAHEHGVIHRDVKPGNVLLEHNGKPWITDFGLARIEGVAGPTTMTGDLLGTLRYMPPEQVSSGRAASDGRGDIYSLGLTLYEFLMLKPAFGAKDREGLLKAITHKEPIRPRQIDPRIPASLENVILRAIRKDPLERYETAGALAKDLTRFIRDEPTLARPPSWWDLSMRRLKRHRAVALSVVAAALVAGVATIVGLQYHVMTLRTVNDQLAARQARIDEMLYVADVRAALDALDQGDRNRATQIVTRQQQLASKVHRGFEWRLLERLTSLVVPQFELRGHQGSVTDLALLPGNPLIVSAGEDGTVRIWDVNLGKQLDQLETGDEPVAVAVSPDARYLATGENVVALWDLETKKLLRRVTTHSATISSIAFSPDGKRLASATNYGPIHLNWLEDEDDESHVIPSLGRHQSLLFSRDGKLLIASDRETMENPDFIGVWDINTRPIRSVAKLRLTASHASLQHLAVSSVGGWIAGGSGYDDRVLFFDITTEQLLHSAPIRGQGFLTALNLSHDDQFCATGYANGTVRWDQVMPEESGRPIGLATEQIFTAHKGDVRRVQFLPDGRLVTCGIDGVIRIWPMFEPAHRLVGPKGLNYRIMDIRSAELSSSGQTVQVPRRSDSGISVPKVLIAAHPDLSKLFYVGSLQDEEWPQLSIPVHLGSIAFSPHGRHLVVAGEEGYIALIDANTLQTQAITKQGDENVVALAFSPDSRLIATGSRKGHSLPGTATIRDAETLKDRFSITLGDSCESLCFSPDGQLLACGQWDGKTTIVDINTHKPVFELRAFSRVTAMAWLLGRDSILTAHHDGQIMLWDIANTQSRQSRQREDRVANKSLGVGHHSDNPRLMTAHASAICSLAVSVDGRTLASCSLDSTVRLWRLPNGEYLGPVFTGRKAHESNSQTGTFFSHVHFTADGGYLLAGRWNTRESRNLLVFRAH